MSLVDVFIVSPAKALVIVDTAVRSQDGTYHEGSKMLALPHANVVLAGRGHNVFLGGLASLLHYERAASFDEFEALMLAKLAETMQHFKAIEQAFEASMCAQEIVLIGYSDGRQSMHAIAYKSETEVEGFKAEHFDDTYVSPWTEGWGAPFNVYTPEHAKFIATVQIDKRWRCTRMRRWAAGC